MTNQSVTVIGEAEYDEYGVVLKSTIVTPYMYNGQYGIENDGDGLYYMRTHFYNVDLKKFMNRDVVMGNIQDSQSLNRYAYVNGNPVNFTDPFGMARETVENTQSQSMSGLDKFQLGLDIAGFFPVVGEIADFANAGIYLYRGQYKEAFLSGLAMVPILGIAATGGKVYYKISGKLGTAKDFVLKNTPTAWGFIKKRAVELWKDESGSIDLSKFVKSSPRKLLKGEGNIGTYKKLKDDGHTGDDLTPHHMPSQKYLMDSMKMDKKQALNDGLSMNLHQMKKGGIHRKTKTYGGHMKKEERKRYLELSPRDALAHDLKDLRRLSMEEGTYPQYRDAIRQYAKEAVEYYNLRK